MPLRCLFCRLYNIRKSSVNAQQAGKRLNVTYFQHIGCPLFSYQAGPRRSEN